MSSQGARKKTRAWIFGASLIAMLGSFFVSLPAAASKKAHPQKQDETCLSCHGNPGMKSDTGRDISINPEKHATSSHGVLGCRDCHTSIKDYPHPAKVAKVRCATCHEEEAKGFAGSAHSILGTAGCGNCHGNAHELKSAETLAPAKCKECHADEVKQFADSIHGQAAAKGDRDAPKCTACHGSIHEVKAAGERDSPVAPRNLANSCAKCHSDAGFLSRHQIPLAHPVESYQQSVHGRAVAAGNEKSADCSSCHGTHDIFPASDARSRVNHWKVSATCGQCHGEIAKIYDQSVHGVAVKEGAKDAPVCVDCHGEHLILASNNPKSPVNAANVSAETCGLCHASARIAALYDLPADRVPSYADSYHGLALKAGKLTAANCASCHGIHNIFKSSDPRSTVNAANLAKTCGQCHTGANQARYAIGTVHVQMAQGPNHPAVRWIRWIYLVLIPVTLGFMVLHNLLDFLSKLVRKKRLANRDVEAVRMDFWFRMCHWGILASFPTLVVTGFALKFPDSWWARPFLQWEASVGVRGGLHRAAAVVLVTVTLVLLIHLAMHKRDRSFFRSMVPTVKDLRDMLHVFRYNLGLAKEAPEFNRFSYAEKLEYWAFLWGVAIMALSGFILWFDNFVLRHFPKWLTDAATAVHWYEALLATFSILFWHLYLVIFDPAIYPMDTSWLDGKAPIEHYRHSRPTYARELLAADAVETTEPAEPTEAESRPSVEPK